MPVPVRKPQRPVPGSHQLHTTFPSGGKNQEKELDLAPSGLLRRSQLQGGMCTFIDMQTLPQSNTEA